MYAITGVAGLWALQVVAARKQISDSSSKHSKGPTAEQHWLPSSEEPKSPAKARAQNLTQIVKDGAIVCFKDKRGHTAVVQPFGTGRSQWQLAVTCASGGVCRLSQGEASLQYVAADATFLACQVDGNKFAFRSLGAEGRYLAATRDLNQPPIIEHHRPTQAAQWRISSSGITNVQYSHKKLMYVVHELKAVPVEAIMAMERMYDVQLQSQRDQMCHTEACAKSLEKQLQEATGQLVAARQSHSDTVEQLTRRWQTAQNHVQQLQQAAASRDEGILQLEQYLEKLKVQHEDHEQELLKAYEQVAQLQQQLDDLELEYDKKKNSLQDALSQTSAAHEACLLGLKRQHGERIKQLTARHDADNVHWAEMRSKLEYSLHQKDREIEELSAKAHRLDAALREVQRLMCGSSRRQRVDRASLNAVSIQQLKAAVAQFAAGGEVQLDEQPLNSYDESQAIHKLLVSHHSDGSSVGEPDDQQVNSSAAIMHGSDGGRDLEFYADQSPGPCAELNFPSAPIPSDHPTTSQDLHDSPLMKLAASNSSICKRGVNTSSGSRQLGRGSTAHSVHRSRAGQSAAVRSEGGAGMSSGYTGSWPGSVSCVGHHQRLVTSGSVCGPSPTAVQGELSALWGTDVAASGSSRRAGSSMASSDQAHRYSCSDASDAESNSQPAADGDYQQDVEDLEAIDTVGQSLEDHTLRQLFTSSDGRHQLEQGSVEASCQKQQQPAGPALISSSRSQQQQQLLRSSAPVSKSSLTPVKEEHAD